VKAIAKGVLVEDLPDEIKAAEARRDRLRQQIAAAQGAGPPASVNVLPATVQRIISDLPRMLAARQVEQVKSALRRLVRKIKVHGEERPGRKRPGAVLVLRGDLEAAYGWRAKKSRVYTAPAGFARS